MIYTFRCGSCGSIYQVEHGINEKHPAKCPVCSGPLLRKFDAFNIHYRDSGFYSTDQVLYEPIKPEDYNPDED